MSTPRHPVHDSTLPPREAQVIELASQGLKTKEIARVMGVSWRTVETYRANAIGRLGASNVAQAVAIFTLKAERERVAASGAAAAV